MRLQVSRAFSETLDAGGMGVLHDVFSAGIVSNTQVLLSTVYFALH